MSNSNNNSTTLKQSPSPAFVVVIDPTSHSGKLRIPAGRTLPTKGRDEWLCGKLRKDLSLCCLFQKGRCNAADRCHQVHADRDYVAILRHEQAHVVSCCRRCNDTASSTPSAGAFFARHDFDADVPVAIVVVADGGRNSKNVIPADRVALTAGLEQTFEEKSSATSSAPACTLSPHSIELFEIAARRVCRLHLRGMCKYGKDCKNVHICSKLGEGVLAHGFASPLIPMHNSHSDDGNDDNVASNENPKNQQKRKKCWCGPVPIEYGIADRSTRQNDHQQQLQTNPTTNATAPTPLPAAAAAKPLPTFSVVNAAVRKQPQPTAAESSSTSSRQKKLNSSLVDAVDLLGCSGSGLSLCCCTSLIVFDAAQALCDSAAYDDDGVVPISSEGSATAPYYSSSSVTAVSPPSPLDDDNGGGCYPLPLEDAATAGEKRCRHAIGLPPVHPLSQRAAALGSGGCRLNEAEQLSFLNLFA